MYDFDDPMGSFTRRQLQILRGRELSELTPVEKIDFANAAPRPIPANKLVPDEFRFRINPEMLVDADPMTKLRIANGATAMEGFRQKIANVRLSIQNTSEASLREGLEQNLRHLQEAAARIYREIKLYELKSA